MKLLMKLQLLSLIVISLIGMTRNGSVGSEFKNAYLACIKASTVDQKILLYGTTQSTSGLICKGDPARRLYNSLKALNDDQAHRNQYPIWHRTWQNIGLIQSIYFGKTGHAPNAMSSCHFNPEWTIDNTWCTIYFASPMNPDLLQYLNQKPQP